MKLALAQLDFVIGDVEANVDRMLEAASDAAARGADLVLFPELSTTGYPPRDLLNLSWFVRAADAALERLVRELPDGVVAVFGAPRRRHDRRGGRALTNSAVVAARGRVLLEVQKALLPTYDVFDERRYFEPAEPDVPRVVSIAGRRVGVTICEDMWNDRLLWAEDRMYDRDPVAECVEQGAELVVNVSASPFSKGKGQTRRRLVSHAATRWRVPLAYVNATGGQDGLLFDGGSLVVAADGALVTELPTFEERVAVVDLAERVDEPVVDELALLGRALVMGTADYAKKTGMSRFCLGLSGGIDSALALGLGALAMGADAGVTFGLPSRYSSEHSIADARALADALGVRFEIVPIDPAHQAYEQMLEPVLATAPAGPGDVTWENVQARVRGATLMAWANRTGALLLTTGNKSECAVGYSTLYGDSCGGLAVIADLFKLEVYALARHLNQHRLGFAIPESTLTKPPSAELRPGQRDDESLPPYEVLDPILRCLIEDELGVDETSRRTGADEALVRSLAKKVFLAEYKRRQFAPTLRVSNRSWTGRDFPIAMRARP